MKELRDVFTGFILGLSYFTIIPSFVKKLDITDNSYKYLLFFLPLIGVILGFIVVGFIYLGLEINIPLFYLLFLGACLYLILYGFLHLEALSDVCDAYVARYSNKDLYSIMKEPQIGAIGAIATFVFVLLKLAVIVFLFLEGKFFEFVFILLLSRMSVLYSLRVFDFHKDSSFALLLKEKSTTLLITVTTVSYFLISYYFLDIKTIVILYVVSLIASLLILRVLKKHFGFLNGDCIGTSIEVSEFILLNIALVFL